MLVQRSEEYTYFLTSHMRDAVNRDTDKQQAAAAAAAQRQSHLQRRLSGAQPDTPAARDQQGAVQVALSSSLDVRRTAMHAQQQQQPSRLASGREVGSA